MVLRLKNGSVPLIDKTCTKLADRNKVCFGSLNYLNIYKCSTRSKWGVSEKRLQVATGLLELNTLTPFCMEERAYLVRRAPVVCFSPHRSLDKEREHTQGPPWFKYFCNVQHNPVLSSFSHEGPLFIQHWAKDHHLRFCLSKPKVVVG